MIEQKRKRKEKQKRETEKRKRKEKGQTEEKYIDLLLTTADKRDAPSTCFELDSV